jgi:hypothetical protein
LLWLFFLFKLFLNLNFFLFFLFYFSFFFLEKKNLFSCGENYSNQKGIFNNLQNITIPIKINFDDDDFFKKKDEKLTTKDTTQKLKIPTKIDFFKNIEIDKIFTGKSSTFIKTKS